MRTEGIGSITGQIWMGVSITAPVMQRVSRVRPCWAHTVGKAIGTYERRLQEPGDSAKMPLQQSGDTKLE